MGNHKFRLTDIIPNAWLYKLMCMRHKGSKNQSMPRSKRRSLQSSPRHSPSPNASKLLPNRASYYISSRAEASDAQLLLDPPRRSKRRSRVKPIIRASATGAAAAGGCGCGCRSWNIEPIPEFSPPASPESPPGQRDYYIDGAAPPELHKLNTSRGVDGDALTSCSHPCSCKITSSPTDIIIDVNTRKLPKKLEEVTMPASEIRLPPILTKPAKKETETAKFENDNKSQIINATPVKARSKIQERRSSSSPPGLHRLRLRTSPRLMSKKALQSPRRGRKSAASAPPPAAAAAMQRGNGFSESFAVVKSSSDPQRDFRDSMLEMIVENDMRTSKDLEDLLTCYLLLNSREYHGIIVEVFKQIWFDLTNIKL